MTDATPLRNPFTPAQTATNKTDGARAASGLSLYATTLRIPASGLPVTEIMDGAQIEMIDAASMDILENVGVQFRDPIALEDWKRVGAKVVGETVYLDRGLVRELIATIPETFTYHARNPANNVRLRRRIRSSCR
jgi:trimethylamine--corrinoid protein Co-methyltransferase